MGPGAFMTATFNEVVDGPGCLGENGGGCGGDGGWDKAMVGEEGVQ